MSEPGDDFVDDLLAYAEGEEIVIPPADHIVERARLERDVDALRAQLAATGESLRDEVTARLDAEKERDEALCFRERVRVIEEHCRGLVVERDEARAERDRERERAERAIAQFTEAREICDDSLRKLLCAWDRLDATKALGQELRDLYDRGGFASWPEVWESIADWRDRLESISGRGPYENAPDLGAARSEQPALTGQAEEKDDVSTKDGRGHGGEIEDHASAIAAREATRKPAASISDEDWKAAFAVVAERERARAETAEGRLERALAAAKSAEERAERAADRPYARALEGSLDAERRARIMADADLDAARRDLDAARGLLARARPFVVDGLAALGVPQQAWTRRERDAMALDGEIRALVSGAAPAAGDRERGP